jgi:hypothetical protein
MEKLLALETVTSNCKRIAARPLKMCIDGACIEGDHSKTMISSTSPNAHLKAKSLSTMIELDSIFPIQSGRQGPLLRLRRTAFPHLSRHPSGPNYRLPVLKDVFFLICRRFVTATGRTNSKSELNQL